jgi:hypothetical protein
MTAASAAHPSNLQTQTNGTTTAKWQKIVSDPWIGQNLMQNGCRARVRMGNTSDADRASARLRVKIFSTIKENNTWLIYHCKNTIIRRGALLSGEGAVDDQRLALVGHGGVSLDRRADATALN